MLKFGILSFFIFCCFGLTEESRACSKPSKKQLRSFFGDQAKWKHRLVNAGVEINFTNPNASKIFKGSKKAKVTSYCISGKTLKLQTSMGEAFVTKSKERLKVKIGEKVATLHKASLEKDNDQMARKQFSHAYYQQQAIEKQYNDSIWIGDDAYGYDSVIPKDSNGTLL